LKFRIDENIELRPPSAENAAELFAVVQNNYEHLRPFLHWVVPEQSLEDIKEFIARSEKESAAKQSLNLSIFYDEKLVGATGFVNFHWSSKSTEIGYWIAKDFEGKGIITKSGAKLIDYAFGELELNRVEIRCVSENIRSRAVPERLGFTHEGTLRQAMWRHTRLYDLEIYGLLKGEWNAISN
jgi:ribosomal-protein-serine acetyltransferase